MKKVILFLSVFFILSSFSYADADFLPKKVFKIYGVGKDNNKEKCHYDIEIGNLFSKVKKNVKIGCEKDFIVSYSNKKDVYDYHKDEASEVNIEFFNEKAENKISSLIVLDEYIGYNKYRSSSKQKLVSGVPFLMKFVARDSSLKNIYLKVTYWE